MKRNKYLHNTDRFGLRVVGDNPENPHARVLWILPEGPAEKAGIMVDDEVGIDMLKKIDIFCF